MSFETNSSGKRTNDLVSNFTGEQQVLAVLDTDGTRRTACGFTLVFGTVFISGIFEGILPPPIKETENL